jgi:hypothetical protein
MRTILSKDPAEEANLAAKHPDIVRRIETIMAAEHVRNSNWDPEETPGSIEKKKGKAKAKADG